MGYGFGIFLIAIGLILIGSTLLQVWRTESRAFAHAGMM